MLHVINPCFIIMEIVIGIDVGGSTTKIIGVDKDGIKFPMLVTADDPVTSLFGAFGKYLYDNKISLSEVKKVMLTGVGSHYVNSDLYGLPTAHADEFESDGLGAHYGSKLKNLIVVSMGTGTSLVKVEGDVIKHIGGVGIGGGTIQVLSNMIFKTGDIRRILELASKGRVENVDLQIRDISNTPLPGLPLYATASSLGKVSANTSDEDMAAGILHMVLLSIGQSAIFSAMNTPIKDFVMIGNLAKIPQMKSVIPVLQELYHVRFHIPQYAEYRTALGAALVGMKEKERAQIKEKTEIKEN